MANWLGVAATRAAWSAKVESASQRLVLLAIAHYADDEGKAFPSVDSICEDTCLSRNTAFKALKELKALGLVSVEKRSNNANQYSVAVDYSDNSSTKIGSTKINTTKIGTTKIGSTKIDTSSSTKIGTTVVPKLVREEEQEESKEESIFCDTASFESVSQSPDDFGFDLLPEEAIEEAPKPEPKKAAKKPKAIPHAFNLDSLPDEWREVANAMAPNLNADQVFASFKFYWQVGRGAGTLRADKGWASSWATWVRKDAERSTYKTTPANSPSYAEPVGNNSTDPAELRRQYWALQKQKREAEEREAASFFSKEAC
jgi:hypothetical protein